MNVTTITVSQLLEALQQHIDKTVPDPTAKQGVDGKVSDILRHPASMAVLQTALPELLKVLTRGLRQDAARVRSKNAEELIVLTEA